MGIISTQRKPLLMLLYNSDISYTRAFGQILNKYFTKVGYHSQPIKLKSELVVEAKKRGTTLLATTNMKLLELVDPTVTGTYNDNVGTVVEFEGFDGLTYRIIMLPILKTLYTQRHGKFLLDHYCNKLANGGILRKDRFTWDFVTPQNLEKCVDMLGASEIAAVDIETSKNDLKITSVAYTWLNADRETTTTRVIKLDSTTYPFCVSAMRRLNNTSTPKVMQNGRYDSSYFLRFNAPLRNYIYDTYHFNHAIFAELPKDLAFISSFYLDNFQFWKDEAGTNLYEYNGKDTHNTLWVFLAQIKFASQAEYQYAFKNYLLLFPLVFPCISCGMEGMQIDEEKRMELREKEMARKEKALARVNYLIGETDFNPGSPKQVKELMLAFGWTKAKSSDVKELGKWRDKAPLTARIVDAILDYRGASKAVSTYFDVTQLNGRLMYALDPSGTESGRMASKESHFWCGTQVQNIPSYARAMVKAEDGWMFGAVDKAQSESYCTGYISQDLTLIDAVNNSPDFHCKNASMFFGIPFEELYDENFINEDGSTGRVLQPKIRKLAKPVNHGANYNMGEATLLETMGEKNVLEAKRILGLPERMSLLGVCKNLLERFDRTYTRIRDMEKGWYREIVMEIIKTKKLTIPAVGYTRRTFLQPTKAKPDLNAAVAHKPQSLSVHLVNKGFMRCWRELQLGKYSGKFRLKAQVHDEVVFITKPELIDTVSDEVAELMTIPTVVEGREMVIPSTKAKGYYWDEAK